MERRSRNEGASRVESCPSAISSATGCFRLKASSTCIPSRTARSGRTRPGSKLSVIARPRPEARLAAEGEQHASTKGAGTAESYVVGSATVKSAAVALVGYRALSDEVALKRIVGRAVCQAA